jgi:hypothetical protein
MAARATLQSLPNAADVRLQICEAILSPVRTRAVFVDQRACDNLMTLELPMNLVNHVPLSELAGLAPASGSIGSGYRPAPPGRSQ